MSDQSVVDAKFQITNVVRAALEDTDMAIADIEDAVEDGVSEARDIHVTVVINEQESDEMRDFRHARPRHKKKK